MATERESPLWRKYTVFWRTARNFGLLMRSLKLDIDAMRLTPPSNRFDIDSKNRILSEREMFEENKNIKTKVHNSKFRV